jgi:Uma2 family endonuclease
MQTRTRCGPCSFGDFLEIIREDQKADLLDGVIYLASPENIDHNRLVGWLFKVIGAYVEERQLGLLTVGRVAYRLSARNAPEPDLGFIRGNREKELERTSYMDGPPDLAIEIVSPDSVDRDYESKRARYEEAGVQEYWIIDPDEQRTTFLVRTNGGFTEVQPLAGVYRSQVLPGFALDTRWLWQKPLPKTGPIITSMLADASDK